MTVKIRKSALCQKAEENRLTDPIHQQNDKSILEIGIRAKNKNQNQKVQG